MVIELTEEERALVAQLLDAATIPAKLAKIVGTLQDKFAERAQ